MRFIKKELAALRECYAVCPIWAGGRLYYIAATDGDGACLAIDAASGNIQTIWEQPGGTMSIIPLPGRDGEFLISQRFLPGFHARDVSIMRVCHTQRGWVVHHWLKLPYVHRFDLLWRAKQYYFLGCILSTTDAPSADWGCPGTLVAAPIEDDFSPPKQLQTIATGMTRNHGYWRVDAPEYAYALTACDEGVFRVIPPFGIGAAWTVEKILNIPASDIALSDIDGDGVDELAVIKPFHGNEFVIYHEADQGYREIYRHPQPMEFLHALWGGRLQGEAVFLGGYRGTSRELFMLRHNGAEIDYQTIETGGGPSNVAVLTHGGLEHVLTANHELGNITLYSVEG